MSIFTKIGKFLFKKKDGSSQSNLAKIIQAIAGIITSSKKTKAISFVVILVLALLAIGLEILSPEELDQVLSAIADIL